MGESEKDGQLGRRQFLQVMGGAIGGIALEASGGGPVEAEGDTHRSSGHHRPFRKKPNFLILMCDEERFPPVYEDEEVRQWRKKNLVTQDLLRNNGMEFKNHYTGATACAPARGTIFTGQYPSLHGVTQTTGVAKGPYDSDTFWLDANNVPTMGDYFRAAGYRTYYKGKWHVSEADLPISGTHQPVLSYNSNTGVPLPEKERLCLNVDRQMLRIFTKLRKSRFYDDTIVIFLSDHGELLGAHGGLHQKWYCAYEEAIHVPLIIHNKHLFSGHQSVKMLTSHVDLLPTMLGLAGADMNKIEKIVSRDHAEVQPLVGRDLSPLILGEGHPERAGEPLYFMTDDDVTRGLDQVNWLGWEYNSVIQPNHVETVIATFEGSGGGKEIWKYSRYFDNPQFWTDPGIKDDVMHEFGPQDPVWGKIKAAVCETTQKTNPVPDEFEMYNVTLDPLEEHNLAGNPQFSAREQQLAAILDQQRCQKRLAPSDGCVPGMPPPCGVPCQE
jgi:hypothetical protein